MARGEAAPDGLHPAALQYARATATGWVTFDAPKHGTIVFHNTFQDDPVAEWTY